MEFVFFRCYYCTANIKPQQTVKLNSQHKAKNERRKPKNKPHHVYTYSTVLSNIMSRTVQQQESLKIVSTVKSKNKKTANDPNIAGMSFPREDSARL